jgi:transposase
MKTTKTKHPPPKAQPGLPVTAAGTSKRRRAGQRAAAVLENLEQINLHAAGIDVGSAENFVCVPVRSVKAGQPTVRSFGVFSTQQDDLVEWLKECGVTSVAMEATGIYWMSLYDKLEAAGLEVLLVDPHSVRHVPGRKSAVLDCQWLQQLHTYGLLRGAFRPEAAFSIRSMLWSSRSMCSF